MRCACPGGGPYSEAACCREEADVRCPAERCQHALPEADAILAELREAHRMLRESKAARDLHREALGVAQTAVERLVGDVERLERALLAAARGDGADEEEERRGGAVALVARVYGVEPMAPKTAADSVDLG